jgi:hypothetical protein
MRRKATIVLDEKELDRSDGLIELHWIRLGTERLII